jgi:hypothetical protein
MNQFSYIVYGARPQFYLPVKTLAADTIVNSVTVLSNAAIYYIDTVKIWFGCDNYVISIDDLHSNDYFLKKPIEVTISDLGDEILAEFTEAEISVSEDTASEALSWIKGRIVGSYVRFKNQRDKLGPMPMRQLQVLEKYIEENKSS